MVRDVFRPITGREDRQVTGAKGASKMATRFALEKGVFAAAHHVDDWELLALAGFRHIVGV